MDDFEILKKIRQNEIIVNLEGLGTLPDTMYTYQEIVDRLSNLRDALENGVIEKITDQPMQDNDFMMYFEAMAKEYGLDDVEVFHRFKNNMLELCYAIEVFNKEIADDKRLRKMFKILSANKNNKVLYNVELENDEIKVRYDVIVIAPYGLFVIEVKNYEGEWVITPSGVLQCAVYNGIKYDIPEEMGEKEVLLWEHLGELFPDEYHGMIMFPTRNVNLKDEYNKISISYGSDVAFDILDYCVYDGSINEIQVRKIFNRIKDYQMGQQDRCFVNCEEIIKDYAILMSEIEACNAGGTKQVVGDKIQDYKDENNGVDNLFLQDREKVSKSKLLKFFGAGVLVGMTPYIISEAMKISKSLR